MAIFGRAFPIRPWISKPPVGAASPPASPNGWFRPFEQAAVQAVIPAALVASGLIWCPQPIAAAADNNVTIDKWQQPLSVAPATLKARFDNQPPPLFPATVAANTVTLEKWQQPLSQAVPPACAIQGSAFVPFNTVQIVAGLVTYDKYQQPLSVAPPVARAVNTPVSFVALPSPQVSLGWYQPLSNPAGVAKPVFVDVPFVARDTQFTQNTVDISKWQQPLSVAAKLAFQPSASVFCVLTTPPPTVGIAGMAWFAPLSVLPSIQRIADWGGAAIVLAPVSAPPPPIVVTAEWLIRGRRRGTR